MSDETSPVPEAIAVVGMSGRFPGAASVAAFWDNLCRGVESISAFSAEELIAQGADPEQVRQPSFVTCGATLADIDAFDAGFFGCSPREAKTMDPQQRLLLECAWEALEQAGFTTETVDRRVGVFVGAGTSGYWIPGAEPPLSTARAERALGTEKDYLAAKLSYKLDLKGPSLTVQTACSTSLVAIHLACQALLTGECDLALAGGSQVNVPHKTGYLPIEAGPLSPDGHCRPFDADAAGTVFGSGVGVVALRRMSDALAAGDPIDAIIRGSAINNDGALKAGFTAPSGDGQFEVIREALLVSGVEPETITFVEGHGTATPLGDPIELAALARAYGRRRADAMACAIGSVKSNVGHLESAAGVAAFIKAVLALKHGVIPGTLHFRRANPLCDFEAARFRVNRELEPWPRRGGPRRAGVSSFGFGGTNAHVILEDPPVALAPASRATSGRPELIVLSAKSAGALDDGARRLHEQLAAEPALELADVAFTLATGRSQHAHRLALVAASRDELLALLEAAGRGESAPGCVRGTGRSTRPRLAWLFTGQGSQALGMGRELRAIWPAFRAAFDAACDALEAHHPFGLRAVLDRTSGPAGQLDRTLYVQPALLALELGLAAGFGDCGITPDFVAGHSLGEIVAAQVAGVFSLHDAARLVAARARLMDALPAGGGMLSIATTEQATLASLARIRDRTLAIAAVNGPTSVVASGSDAGLRTLQSELGARGIRTQHLAVSHAFHSPLMDAMLDDFARVASSVEYRAPQRAIVSCVSGAIAGAEIATADYWVEHVRKPVRFADALSTLASQDTTRFLEIGPRPTLLGLIPEVWVSRSGGDREPACVPSLRPGTPERVAILEALAQLFVDGDRLAGARLFPDGARRVALPTYAWQRERYWVDSSPAAAPTSGRATGHPLLGTRIARAGTLGLYETVITAGTHGWLFDHRVAGSPIVPGAAFAELLLAAGMQTFDGAPHELRSFVLRTPLVLAAEVAHSIEVVVTEEAGAIAVSAYGREAAATVEEPWTLHASATLVRSGARVAADRLDLDLLRSRCARRVGGGDLYAGLAERGLAYGPAFQPVSSVAIGIDDRGHEIAIAELANAEPIDGAARFGVHPALLDGGLQALAQLGLGEGRELHLPFMIEALRVHAASGVPAVAYVRRTDPARPEDYDVTLAAAGGDVLVEVVGLRSRALRAVGQADPRHALYRVTWPVAEVSVASEPRRPQRWVIAAEAVDPRADALEHRLRERGETCTRIALDPVALTGALPADHVVLLWPVRGLDRAAHAIELARQGLAVTRALLGATPVPRMWWITQGAVAVSDREAPAADGAALWGLGRTLNQEHPELSCSLVDVADDDAAIGPLADELGRCDQEREVALRDGRRHVARLERAELSRPPARALRRDATALITGGLGALGLHVARWLARQGVKHLVLTGRRGAQTPGAAAAVAELEAVGARVTIAALDVCDRAAVAATLRAIPAELPLRVVVHAAGVLDDGVMREQDAARFARVIAPKAIGSELLDDLTRGADLDLFVVVSSLAGTTGSPGQGAYGAANAFMDAVAASRRAAGVPAHSVAWGPWADVGMAAALDARQRARMTRQGLHSLAATDALRLLEQAVGLDQAHVVAMALDVGAMRSVLADEVPPLWRRLVREPTRARKSTLAPWPVELAALPVHRRKPAVLDGVRAEIARVLAMPGPEAVPSDRPLQELGLDSMLAIDLRNALGKRVGATLPATLAFDHPTPAAISTYLADRVLQITGSQPGPVISISAPRVEPIAIVGTACRYPGGVTDAASLWELLDRGLDGVTEVPLERWDVDAIYDPDPDAVGKMMTRSGGFVRDVDLFDPAFFGISAREARRLDPQHRLLLETSWEALEQSGIVPERLVGTDTGVFVGHMYNEYGALGGNALEQLDGYVATGTAPSLASGRISYVLGLQGPSMTVDTACSSSLVTVHLACQAIRDGECGLALAGGVALVLTPAVFVEFSRLRGLAPDGRSKSFSAAADGVAWSEGCGMLVLERLSDARRNGHRVLGLIRGSAVNQDGRSNGLTAPNGPAQEALIRRALAQAGVAAAAVDFVECHGTGTTLGDPVEAQALGEVLSAERPANRPLLIGSIKSNLGHTQAAAGVAGIMKVLLAFEHERIPKNLHFAEPNPHIAWDELQLAVVTESTPWPRGARPRIAGVSSFGVSGTNAHVVLEEAPPVEAAAPERSAELVVLSARTPEVLDDAARRLREHVEAHPEHSLGELAFSLATTRTHDEHRVAFAVETRAGLCAALEDVGRGGVPQGGSRARALPATGKLAWLFSGQGSQRLGMGRALAAEWPVFREALDRACVALDVHLDVHLLDVMWASPEDPLAGQLAQTGWTQPALFAFESALAALWQSLGAEPDLLVGHSIGELVAAYVAGVFSLEDAARLVAARGRLMQALPAGGAMVSIAAPEAVVADAVAAHAATVSIAATNGPDSIVISGAEAVVREIADDLARRGMRTRPLAVSHAFHSPLMDPMLDELRRVAESVTYRPAAIPLVSNLTGTLAGPELATPGYWVEHVRAPVRFGTSVRQLHAAGVTRFVELGPKATLVGMVPDSLPAEAEPVLVASLRADRPEAASLLDALSTYHASGGQVAWSGVFPAGARSVSLPTYAWRRQRHWFEARGDAPARALSTGRPLIGARVSLAGVAAAFETTLSRGRHAWIDDHRIGGHSLVPAALFVELARAAAEQGLARGPVELVALALRAPLTLPERGDRRVQVLVDDGERARVSIYSQAASARADAPWTLHASSEIRATTTEPAMPIDLAAVRARTKRVDPAGASGGWYRGDGEVLAEIAAAGDASTEGDGVHPAVLDAALAAAAGLGDRDGTWLPVSIDRVTIHDPGATVSAVHARQAAGGEGTLTADVALCDRRGRVVAEISRVRLAPADLGAIATGDTEAAERALYRVAWPEASRAAASSLRGRWLVVAEPTDELADAVVRQLAAAGAACERIERTALGDALPADHVVCLWDAATPARPDAALQVATAGLAVVQRVAAEASSPRLWWVTARAVSVSEGELVAPELASLWGLGRTVMLEHPELRCRLVDIERGPAAAGAIIRELALADDEQQVAWRAGQRRIARLTRAPAAIAAGGRGLRCDGTALVTGGLGTIGLLVAKRMAERGMRHLVLTGRRGSETPGAAEATAALEALGARVTIAAVDVADRDGLAAVLAAIPGELPLRAIVHAAGLLDDGVLTAQTPARFATVIAPKALGALHLDALTRDADLDCFVMCSSAAGTFGSPGQGAYTAANAVLDGLAANRRARGLPAHSLAWGSWTDASGRSAGLAASAEAATRRPLDRTGLGAITPTLGIAVFDAALRRRDSQLVAVPIDVVALGRTFGDDVPSLWRGLVRVPPKGASSIEPSRIEDLSALDPARRAAAVLDIVKHEVARVLSLPGSTSVRADQRLQELGLDSLVAVALRNALGKRMGTVLPTSLAFDHPTPTEIARFLDDRLSPSNHGSHGQDWEEITL